MEDKPLTRRQEEFIKNFAVARLDPKRQKECAIRAGYTPSSALVSTHRLLTREDVRRKVTEAMERAGVTLDMLADKHREMLNAMHPFAPKQPDNLARIQALNLAYKIGDFFPANKLDINKREEHVFLTQEDEERIRKADDAIDAEIVEDNLNDPTF